MSCAIDRVKSVITCLYNRNVNRQLCLFFLCVSISPDDVILCPSILCHFYMSLDVIYVISFVIRTAFREKEREFHLAFFSDLKNKLDVLAF